MYSASTRKERYIMRGGAMLSVLLLFCLLCLPAAAAQMKDTTKAVIVSFHYKDGTVTPTGSRVIYGYPPDNIAHQEILVDLVGKNNAVIRSCGIDDPRILYYDTGAILETDITFSVILPFAAGGDHVDLFDGRTKQKLASADITGAITKFCDAHRDDPDCGGGGAPALLYGAAILLVLVVIGSGAYIFLKRKKTTRNK